MWQQHRQLFSHLHNLMKKFVKSIFNALNRKCTSYKCNSNNMINSSSRFNYAVTGALKRLSSFSRGKKKSEKFEYTFNRLITSDMTAKRRPRGRERWREGTVSRGIYQKWCGNAQVGFRISIFKYYIASHEREHDLTVLLLAFLVLCNEAKHALGWTKSMRIKLIWRMNANE